ncbi:MAG: DUF885 family protein [Gammaproteobacteria bacterium]|nr:DUF885 family protein [Gammaproteobacteria bacterium]MBT5205084.1 DUF885 family protein [Gammaproteobacteria bacterium]MBT5603954.1 DUF885 family protein [Gammaproteobacteria bacterium]MBT6244038.1 DUF885 family protein [Gammaproteobacteria bacterium]
MLTNQLGQRLTGFVLLFICCNDPAHSATSNRQTIIASPTHQNVIVKMEQLIFDKLVKQAVDEIRTHPNRLQMLNQQLEKIDQAIRPAMLSSRQKDQLALLNWLDQQPQPMGSVLDKAKAQCAIENQHPEQLYDWLEFELADLIATRTTQPESVRRETKKTVLEGIPANRTAKHLVMSMLQDSLIQYIELNVLQLSFHDLDELIIEELNSNESYLPLFRYRRDTQAFQINLTEQPLLHFVELEAAALFYGVPGQHYFNHLVKTNPVYRLTQCSAFSEAYAQYLLRLSGSEPVYQQHHAVISQQEWLISLLALALADLELHVIGVEQATVLDTLSSRAIASRARLQFELEQLTRQPGQAFISAAIARELIQIQQTTALRLGSSFRLVNYLDRLNQVISLPLPLIREKMTLWTNDHDRAGD